MGSIFRTAIWTIAAIVVIFTITLFVKWHRAQENKPGTDSLHTGKLTPANPGGNWPQFHGDRAQSGYVTGDLPDKLSLVWRFKAGNEVKSSPVVMNGIVYFGSSDKHIYSIDLKTGKQVWSKVLNDEIEASPTVIDNMVYIGTLTGTLYALNTKSGTEQWEFRTGDKIIGGANWFKDPERLLRILSGSYDSILYCIDAQTGKPLWKYATGNFINGSPAMDMINFAPLADVMQSYTYINFPTAKNREKSIQAPILPDPLPSGETMYMWGTMRASCLRLPYPPMKLPGDTKLIRNLLSLLLLLRTRWS